MKSIILPYRKSTGILRASELWTWTARIIPSKPVKEVSAEPSEQPKKTAGLGNEPYSKMLQGKATNVIAHTSKKGFLINPINQIASTEYNGITIFLRNYSNIVLNVPTKKVLDILTIKLTSNFPYGENVTTGSIDNHRNVEITLDEYMRACNLKNKKEAKKQLNESIQSLFDVAIEWDEEKWTIPKGKKKRIKQTIHWKARILDTIGNEIEKSPIQNGKATVKFTFDIAKYLSQSFVMEYPVKLLKVNGKRNPHSYFLGRKIALHHNMNIGKENQNRISVVALIHACPDLPSYDDVKVEGKHITQQIIQPFERDLIALKGKYGILKDWHYCNSKGEPLTDEQVENYSYSTWKDWLVEFELADYPDQSDRIAKIEERKKKAYKRKVQAR